MSIFKFYFSYSNISPLQRDDHGTSHVSVLDAEGNGVSATSTINWWMGAVVQSEGLGVLWNNEMDDFASPDLPSPFGYALVIEIFKYN